MPHRTVVKMVVLLGFAIRLMLAVLLDVSAVASAEVEQEQVAERSAEV